MDFRAVEFRPFRAGLYFDVRTHRALPWAITLRPVGAKGKKPGDSPHAMGVNEVNNVRRQSRQHGQFSQHCPKISNSVRVYPLIVSFVLSLKTYRGMGQGNVAQVTNR